MPDLPAYLNNELLANQIGQSLSGRDAIFPSRENIRKIGPINSLREFKELGVQSLKVLLNYTNIQPSSHVLDIGCGYGRLAIPLTRYLDHEGVYWGVDVMREAIEDCKYRFGEGYPNFGFQHVDFHNGLYNPEAGPRSSDSILPFPDNHFDTVFLFSVFSHMKPDDVSLYFSEIHRILRPAGMLMATCFLLTQDARAAIERGNTRRSFRFADDGFFVDTRESPESAIAYLPDQMDALIAASGLHHVHTFDGQWADRRWALSGQDAVICTKPD